MQPDTELRPFALVRVPFPLNDPQTPKRRPALVISKQEARRCSGHVLLAMVTSASPTLWPLDWVIQVLSTTGLKQPSVVRMKLFTLDERLLLGTLGRLAAIDQQGVKRQLRALLPDLG
jgi:mRNA interferase MazF